MKWTFHAGDSFLASLDPSFSPDVAMATRGPLSGDTLALGGMGTFSPGGPVTGGGLFWHNSTNFKHHGTWTAVAVLSYDDFGNGIVDGFPRSFHGGQLVLSVTFTPVEISVTFSGTLTVTCLIGDSVPAGVDEGIMASIPGVITFDESVSGNTLFVLMP